MTATENEPIDFDRLHAEINEEVRKRRQAGDFPPGIERELDEIFAQFAPKKVSLDDLSDLMAKAEEASFLDSEAPTSSFRKGGAIIKKGIARGVGWYVRYLAQNTTVFASTVSRIMRLLDAKIEVINETVFREPARVAGAAASATRAPSDLSAWHHLVVDALQGVSGRVLHVESGDGSVVGALIAAGVDAYGVEPSEALAVGSASTALDVRIDDALTHLRSLPNEGLAGLVLAGCVDRLAAVHQLELVELAATKTTRDGIVVLIGANPAAASPDDRVATDLAPGRPLHPETWEYLLRRNGLHVRATEWEPTPAALEPLDGKVQGAAAFNQHLDRLNHLLSPPPTYAVVAGLDLLGQ